MANVAAALHHAFGHHWVGFYRVLGDELVLGPFQGPVACLRIPYGKGVCGAAWEQKRTLVVPDVNQFPGHIACSPLSLSEIVVPVKGTNGQVAAILDLDSSELDAFDEVDRYHLEGIADHVGALL
jgi:L-methionine (R)-S-oxide reductase